MITPPSIFTAKVSSIIRENPKDIRINLLEQSSHFTFTPGQYITLKVSEHFFRSYSICSDPKNLPELSLLIETAHKGVGADYINSLKIGDVVTFVGPSGKLSLPQNLPNELFFFATGTGITPFISMLHHLQKIKFEGNITLYLGIRKENETIFLKELAQFHENLKNFNYHFHISQPENKEIAPSRITSVINQMTNKNAFYFLCGHPLMIEEIENGLIKNGIPAENIFKEGFTRSKQAEPKEKE